MKTIVKAVYRSKVNNKSIIILDEVFMNNKPRVISVDEKGLKALKGMAKQDWFDILEIYGEEAPAAAKAPTVKPPAPVETPAVVETAKEEAPAPVEEAAPEIVETPAEEATTEEAPVAEAVTEEAAAEETAEAPAEDAEPEKKSSKSRKTKKTEE